MPKLIVFPKTEECRKIELIDIEKLRIGRASDNDVVINRRMASRKHAMIERRGEDYFLVDLGSFNGTFLNRRRIKESLLNDRDIIQIADRVMVFDYSEDMGSAAQRRSKEEPTVRLSAPPAVIPPEAQLGAANAGESEEPEKVEHQETGFDFSITPEDLRAFQEQTGNETPGVSSESKSRQENPVKSRLQKAKTKKPK
jgi:pSer/pThr/pTyr-binding forkhead associated (FHA) protein